MANRYKELMDNIPGVFFRCACDEHWTMEHMSNGVEALIGYSVDHIVGNRVFSFASLIHHDDADNVERDVLQAVESHTAWNLEYRLRRRDGSYIWVSEQGVGIYDEAGKVRFLDGFVADISERKEIQEALLHSKERIRELAFYDSLTCLPNRNMFLEKIEEQLKISSQQIALLYIDLDGFKSVNDSFGHGAGDEVLALTGSRLQGVVPDSELVARIGGDEFTVLCKSNATEAYCISLARDIIEQVSRPIAVQDQTVELGASIGISFSTANERDTHALISAADKAMFVAKQAGSNLVEISGSSSADKAA